MKTAIATDTNSGITRKEAEQLGIYLLPMPVIIEEQCYFEGIDMTNEQLYKAIKMEKNVSSSQPSPGDILDLWKEIFQEGYNEIVYIPMTSGLSGTCQTARILSENFKSRVKVIDNHRISVTLRESVLEAKEMADAGQNAEQIKKYLENTAYQQSIFLTVSSLKYLKKGGRLSLSAAALGTVLNIKPILSIQGGKIELFSKSRGIKNSQKKMIEALKEDISMRFLGIPKTQLRIYTAGTLERQEEITNWLNMVQNYFPDYEVRYFQLPCSIACHVGVDCMGIGAVVHKLKDSDEYVKLEV